jgi:hypothetical protein
VENSAYEYVPAEKAKYVYPSRNAGGKGTWPIMTVTLSTWIVRPVQFEHTQPLMWVALVR